MPVGRRLHVARLAVQRDVEPVADLLALALGHAEHPGDDLDRERRREVGHRVEARRGRRAGRGSSRITSRTIGSRAVIARGREHPAHEGPQPVVLGRVHHDDHLEGSDHLGVLRERRQVDAVRAREPLPVAVGGDHVGEARQRVEAVALVEVHRRLVAQAAVDLGRVVEVLVGERVELHCGRGHGASEAEQNLAAGPARRGPIRSGARGTAVRARRARSATRRRPGPTTKGCITAPLMAATSIAVRTCVLRPRVVAHEDAVQTMHDITERRVFDEEPADDRIAQQGADGATAAHGEVDDPGQRARHRDRHRDGSASAASITALSRASSSSAAARMISSFVLYWWYTAAFVTPMASAIICSDVPPDAVPPKRSSAAAMMRAWAAVGATSGAPAPRRARRSRCDATRGSVASSRSASGARSYRAHRP